MIELRFDEEKETQERLKKEAEDRHLYLNVKLLNNDIIKTHHGLDLSDGNLNLSLGNTAFFTSKFRKDMTYKELKVVCYLSQMEIAEKWLGVSEEQIRLWPLSTRQNKTIRPDNALNSNCNSQSLLEIATATCSKNSTLVEFCAYVEVSLTIVGRLKDHPLYFPEHETLVDETIMLFIKYYDSTIPKMEFLQTITIPNVTQKIADILPRLNSMKDLPHGTVIQLYEEVKPGMIDTLKTNQTFQQAELGSGDIICYQCQLSSDQYLIINSELLPLRILLWQLSQDIMKTS